MLALVFDGKVTLRTDYPDPMPGEGEALIAVRTAGICATDLEITKGYMGFRGVMGHEFVGEVVDGPAAWKHKRVVGEINCICGTCDLCTSGLSTHCRHRTVLGIDGRDGVFAERVVLPVRNLHEVPDAVADEQAVFVEPLAAAFQITRQVKLDAATSVVVLGAGRLGQLVARVMKQTGVQLVLVGRSAAKLEAAEKVGIRTALLDMFTPGKDTDVVVDATGNPEGFEWAMRTVRPRGTIVLKSTVAAESGMNLAPLVINEITVVGSRCGPFPAALRALAGGEIDVSALITKRFALADAPAALDAAEQRDALKILLDVR